MARKRIQTEVSTKTISQKQQARSSGNFAFSRRPFPAPRDILRKRLRSTELAQALVSGRAHQGLQTETDGLGVSRGTARQFGLLEDGVVDVESFLHMDNYAMKVWVVDMVSGGLPVRLGVGEWRRVC